jgi:hypothetical protein
MMSARARRSVDGDATTAAAANEGSWARRARSAVVARKTTARAMTMAVMAVSPDSRWSGLRTLSNALRG